MPISGEFSREWSFSWSSAAHYRFRRCPRSWFYRYPGSWGGWDIYAEDSVRLAYQYKHLLSYDGWLERVFRETIRWAMLECRHHRSSFSQAAINDYAQRRLRREWQTALRSEWPGDPKSHYFREWIEDVPERVDVDFRELSRRLRRVIANFADSTLARNLLSIPSSAFRDLNAPISIKLSGETVWMAPDLCWRDGGELHLLMLYASGIERCSGWALNAGLGWHYLKNLCRHLGLKPVLNSFFAGEGEGGLLLAAMRHPGEIPTIIAASSDMMRMTVAAGENAAGISERSSCEICEFRTICPQRAK